MKFLKLILLSISLGCMSLAQANEEYTYMEEWYGEKFNVSPKKAKERISIANEAREISNTLDIEDTKSGGMYIENSPKFRIVFNVKKNKHCKYKSNKHCNKTNKEFRKRIKKIIKNKNWNSFARIKYVKYSLADLKTVQDELQEIIEEYATEGAKISTPSQGNSIILKVINLAEFENKLLADNVSLPEGVKLEELYELPNLSVIFGGGDATGVCSFGFVVQDSRGVKGLSTAEHCGENTTWAGIALTFRNRILSRDTQWLELPGNLQAEAKNLIVSHIYNGAPSFRPITGTYVLGVGASVCMFGAESGRKCGIISAVNQVEALRHPITNVVNYYGNLTHVTVDGKANGGAVSTGGDSGGPYYAYNNAIGQVVGGDTLVSFYTPIANVTAMGVSVLTQ